MAISEFLKCYGDIFRNWMPGILGIIGLCFFHRRNTISDKSYITAHAQLEINQKSVNDQTFLNAIKLFEKENDNVRAGAIHALERISNYDDSYYLPIMKIFCHFIRANSHKGRKGKNLLWMREDIKAILKLITYRPQDDPGGVGFDLSNSYLNGVLIKNQKLKSTNFGSSMLQYSYFCLTDLSHSNFIDCDLMGTKFVGVDISCCYFLRANIIGVDFSAIRNNSEEILQLIEGWEQAVISYDGMALQNQKFFQPDMNSKFTKAAISGVIKQLVEYPHPVDEKDTIFPYGVIVEKGHHGDFKLSFKE